jgi:hypothetical protein
MIKMIRGVFGLPVNGIVKAMDKNSGPFEAGEEQEARLIRLGLAVRVEDGEPAPADEPNVEVDTDSLIGFDDMPPEAVAEEKAIEDMNAKELREFGKELGLTFKVGMSKADMLAAIKAAWPQPVEDEDGEPAPVFDAAEAVQ